VANPSARFVQPSKAPARHDPQRTGPIFQQLQDAVVRGAAGCLQAGGIIGEKPGLRVIAVQTLAGAEPDPTPPVLQD